MKREKRIDFLKAWGIFLVVLGHAQSPFHAYIYTFHMPLFFFVTGYLRYNSKDLPWKEFFKRKVSKILIPYVVFWIISIAYNQIYTYIVTNEWASIGTGQLKGLLLGGHWLADYSNNFPLWYLQLLFIAMVLFELIVRYCNKYFKATIHIILMIITIPFQNLLPGRPVFHINVLPAALAFMLMGYAFRYKLENCDVFKKIKNNTAIGILLIVFGWQVSTIHYGNISQINSYLYFVGALCTVIGTYIIGKWFENIKLVTYLGNNTLYIMGLHSLVFYISRKIVNFFFGKIGIENLSLKRLSIVILNITICCGLIEIYKVIKENLNKQQFLKIKNCIMNKKCSSNDNI